MSPARAIRLALGRAAEDLFELDLAVSGIQLARVGQDGLQAQFNDDRLLMVLDGPDGALGAAAIDLQVLAGLIETQTMGRVLPGPTSPRSATQTDAAMVAPLLDAFLSGMSENLAGRPAESWVHGFRFGAWIESVRMLGLLLEAPEFHLCRMELELGGGAKQGEMMLALPFVLKPAEHPTDALQTDRSGDGEMRGPSLLGQGALLEAEAPLDAILWRMRVPLSELQGLAPGAVLHIPRETLTKTRLEADKDRLLAQCRLGQINGFRAVRVVQPQSGNDARQQGEGTAPEKDGQAHPAGAERVKARTDSLIASDADMLEHGVVAERTERREKPDLPETTIPDPMARQAADVSVAVALDGLPDLSELPELALEGPGAS